MVIKPEPATGGNIYLPSQDSIQKALGYARGMFRPDPDRPDLNFKEFPRERRQEICHPNQLYVARKDIGRMGVLVAWQASPEHDWALNKHGLEYLYGAQ